MPVAHWPPAPPRSWFPPGGPVPPQGAGGVQHGAVALQARGGAGAAGTGRLLPGPPLPLRLVRHGQLLLAAEGEAGGRGGTPEGCQACKANRALRQGSDREQPQQHSPLSAPHPCPHPPPACMPARVCPVQVLCTPPPPTPTPTRQEHETALRYFQRALQLDPTLPYAYTLAGHEYFANEDFEKGITCYRNAIRIDPRHYNAWWVQGGGRGACPGALCVHGAASMAAFTPRPLPHLSSARRPGLAWATFTTARRSTAWPSTTSAAPSPSTTAPRCCAATWAWRCTG
jgi:tetratricopeptide (TPR) repeat protein